MRSTCKQGRVTKLDKFDLLEQIHQLNRTLQICDTSSRQISAAEGSQVSLKGGVILHVEIWEYKIIQTFYILPRLQYQAIIGRDFSRKTQCKIDFGSKKLDLYP